jgi:hypothetical protein
VTLGLPRTPVLIALLFELVFPPVVVYWHAMAVKADRNTQPRYTSGS